MFRKNVCAHLVFLGLILSWIVGDCFGEHIYERKGLSGPKRAELLYSYVTAMWPSDEIWPQMHGVLKKIGAGDYTASEAAVDQLLADYSANQYLPVALHEIAKLYRLVEERDRSLQLHQHVIDNWPSHEYTMWSLRDLAIVNIALGAVEDAEAAVNRALTDFANNVYIAFVGYDIAGYYKDFEYYQEAKELYEYVIDQWPEQEDYVHWCQKGLQEANLALADQAPSESEITTQVELVEFAIASGDMNTAESAIDALLSTYSENPCIARPLFDIAECYQQFQKYQKSKELFEYVVSTWPQHASARWSQSGVAMCHIGLGDTQAAEAATNELLADFSMNVRMANCLYDIAQQYHKFNHHEKARHYFQTVLDNWPDCRYAAWAKIGLARSYIGLGDGSTAESIVDGLITTLNTDFPTGTQLSPKAAESYYYAGGCYRQLERYEKSIQCYQRVVNDCPDYEYAWNAQFLIGRGYESLSRSGVLTEPEANPEIRAAYKQILDKYPDSKAAKYARKWLSR